MAVQPEHQLIAPGSLRSRAQSLLYQAVHDGTLEREAALAQLERITEIKVRLLDPELARLADGIVDVEGIEVLDK